MNDLKAYVPNRAKNRVIISNLVNKMYSSERDRTFILLKLEEFLTKRIQYANKEEKWTSFDIKQSLNKMVENGHEKALEKMIKSNQNCFNAGYLNTTSRN